MHPHPLMRSPIIAGIPGPVLDVDTQDVLTRLNPVGYILFKRNCVDEAQLKKLCTDLYALTPGDAPLIFIDQEGGRINRIDWLPYKAPAGQVIGQLYEQNPPLGLRVAYLNAFLLASHLRPYGIHVNCLPLADVAYAHAHSVIGDRAFSDKPAVVASLAKATAKGQLAGGCWPIIKHAPGHGRATADSHKSLPVIEATLEELTSRDFLPFQENADCPFVMTAHILYAQIDPTACATQSTLVLEGILRQQLGMTGLIVSDDLYMEALTGDISTRARASLQAGCDLLLVCAGVNDDLACLADLHLTITPEAAARMAALPALGVPSDHEVAASLAELHKLWPHHEVAYAV